MHDRQFLHGQAKATTWRPQMRSRPFFRTFMMVLAIGAAALAQPSESRADTPPVDAGYDLFTTVPSETSYNFGGAIGTQNLMGVPLGTYNFGGSIGTQSVPYTDTIVQRMSDVTRHDPAGWGRPTHPRRVFVDWPLFRDCEGTVRSGRSSHLRPCGQR